jgi:hypothetical protein
MEWQFSVLKLGTCTKKQSATLTILRRMMITLGIGAPKKNSEVGKAVLYILRHLGGFCRGSFSGQKANNEDGS